MGFGGRPAGELVGSSEGRVIESDFRCSSWATRHGGATFSERSAEGQLWGARATGSSSSLD